jgi:putative transposase
MARIARAVVPQYPHHITQRGNRRQSTFFSENDYQSYVDLMHECCTKYSVQIWGYCLMPNHVHLIAVPEDEGALAVAIGEAHRRYTWQVNSREGWRGHLWQGRFASYVMQEDYLLACIRYIELNPVRAGLVTDPTQWAWSSARAHVTEKEDALVSLSPLLDMVACPWAEFLGTPVSDDLAATLRQHERTGRPLGDDSFVEKAGGQIGRLLKPARRGPKRGSHRHGTAEDLFRQV